MRREPVPAAGLCTHYDFTEEMPTHFVRDATIGAKDLREIITLEAGRKVTFFQATGLREGTIADEILEYEFGTLHLRIYCYIGLRDAAPNGHEERAEGRVRQRHRLQGRAAVDGKTHPRPRHRRAGLTRIRGPTTAAPPQTHDCWRLLETAAIRS